MEPWWGLRSSVTGVESALPPLDQLAWGCMRTGGPNTNALSMREREGVLSQACVLMPRAPPGLLRTGARG